MSELQNLRFKDASWRPISDMKVIEGWEDDGYATIYIHRTRLYAHILATKGNALYYVADLVKQAGGTDEVCVMRAEKQKIFDIDDDAQMFANGNLLSFIASQGIMYTLFGVKDDDSSSVPQYIALSFDFTAGFDGGDTLPNGGVLFRTTGIMDDVHIVFNNSGATTNTSTYPYHGVPYKGLIENVYYNNNEYDIVNNEGDNRVLYSDENVHNIAKALMAKALHYETKASHFTGFFLATSVLELYDGSLICMSRPVLCGQAVDYRTRFRRISYKDKGTLTDSDNTSHSYASPIGFFKNRANAQATIQETSEDLLTCRVRNYRTVHVSGLNKPDNEIYMNARFGIESMGSAQPITGKNDSWFITEDNQVTNVYNPDMETDRYKAVEDLLPNFYCQYSYSWQQNGNNYYRKCYCYAFSNKLQFFKRKDVPGDYKPLIKKVHIAITRQHYSQDFENTHTIIANYNHTQGLFVFPNNIKDKDVVNNICGDGNFYIIKSFSIDEWNNIANGWHDVELEEGVLLNLTTNRSFSTDDSSRNTFYPQHGLMYNGKLHIANFDTKLYSGYPLDEMRNLNYIDLFSGIEQAYMDQCYLSNTSNPAKFANRQFKNPPSALTLYRPLASTNITDIQNMADMLVQLDGQYPYIGFKHRILYRLDDTRFCAIVKVKIASNSLATGAYHYVYRYADLGTTITYLNPLLSYPNLDAKEMEIMLFAKRSNQGDWYKIADKTFPLKAGEFSFAYYLEPNLLPISLYDEKYFNNLFSPQESARLSRHPRDIYKDIVDANSAIRTDGMNKIRVSKVDNPLVFPVEQTYTVGQREILGLGTNAHPLSVGQAGETPLIVWCSDGIYGLFVSASGEITYSNSRPISTDVLSNKKSICNVLSGLTFTTLRGFLLLSGGNVIDLGALVQGQPIEDGEIEELSHIQSVFSELRFTDVNFLDYIQEALVAFNYRDKEIYVVNKKYDYSYIYSEQSGWTTTTQTGNLFVDDYPYVYLRRKEDGALQILGDENKLMSNVPIMLISQPLKLNNTQDFKQIERIITRSLLKAKYVTVATLAIWGSHDARTWSLLGANDVKIKEGDFSRDIGTEVERNDCKFFRYGLFAKIGTDSYIDFTDVQYATKLLNEKIR